MAYLSAADSDAQPSTVLRAEAGDILIVDQNGAAGVPRSGQIIAVRGPDGMPPYVVRWVAGDYESTIVPGPGARVEKHHRAHRAAA